MVAKLVMLSSRSIVVQYSTPRPPESRRPFVRLGRVLPLLALSAASGVGDVDGDDVDAVVLLVRDGR